MSSRSSSVVVAGGNLNLKAAARTSKLPLAVLLVGSASLGMSSLADLLASLHPSPSNNSQDPRIFTVDESGQEKEETNSFFVSSDDDEAEVGTIRYREFSVGDETSVRMQILDVTGLARNEQQQQRNNSSNNNSGNNAEDSYVKPLSDLISSRLLRYMEQSDIEYQMRSGKKSAKKIDRNSIVDARIHCCLYFLTPPLLLPEDIFRMKALAPVVNLLPVIGRADTLTPVELADFKSLVRRELESNGIAYYGCPGQDTEYLRSVEGTETSTDSEDSTKQHQHFLEEFSVLREQIPFGIVSSSEEVEINGKTTKGRKYPYGTIDVLDPAHCDTPALLKLLDIAAEELKIRTVNVIYKEYLKQKLAELKKAS